MKALGMAGISKSRISELCERLDEEVERFGGRPLEDPYPYYVWLDATYYVKARQDGRVASVAVVIAVGVKADYRREGGVGPRGGPQRGRGVVALFPALLPGGQKRSLGRAVGHY